MIFSALGAVYDGPVVQTQDLTVINITKEAVVSRQAKVSDQLPPIPGEQRAAFDPVAVPPPDWWAEELIPLDEGDDIKQLQDQNEQLKRKNEFLETKIGELETRLTQYENADTPPSQKPGPNRKKSGSDKRKARPKK